MLSRQMSRAHVHTNCRVVGVGSRASGTAISALGFDLDGTVYLGSELLPGAADLISALADAGVPYLLVTNNSSKTGEQYVANLLRLGLPASRSSVLTSKDVAIAHLHRSGVRRPFLVATPAVRQEFRDHGFEPVEDQPDAVLITFDTTLDYAKLSRATGYIRAGLPYFATNPDLTCPTPQGPVPDCGSFAALFAAATGVQPVVLGKPEALMAEALQARLGVQADGIAFVGDRLYTDVRMARENGFQAVLTLTGEARREDLVASQYAPDLVFDDLRGLHAHLERLGTLPSSARG